MPFYLKENEEFWRTRDAYGRPKKNRKKSNTAAIKSLQRKVAQLAPEVQQFGETVLYSMAPSAYTQQRLDFSNILAAATDRDTRITGDSWRNKYIKFRLQCFEAGINGILRVIILTPKKAGTTFTFPENQIVDPNQATVYYDRTMTVAEDQRIMTGTVSLKNLKSTYVGTLAEKGTLHMYVMYRNNNTTIDFFNLAYQYGYTDM